MDFKTKYGPWALITGASAGLGAVFAQQLAAKGLHLLLVARRKERLESLASSLRSQHGVEVRCLALDLLHPKAIQQLQTASESLEFGLLVNNAGFGRKGNFLATDAVVLGQMVRLNCEVVALLSHAFLPSLVQRGHGGMIVLSSTAAYQPTPTMAVYGATKGFDLLFAEALAEELRNTGVDVLAVSPGTTDTEFHQVAGGLASANSLASPEDVVTQSLTLLGRRSSFIHGLRNRILCFSTRFAPRGLVARMSARILRKYQERPL